ncbi:MAG: alpha-1,2-fucosyltransferase [Spirochaetes bacterium]|nr:alpha-1,2-fucosyltransferase [Spirochaetota bacterium]
MIIVKLMGGLGNQMFQYAFGRFLSLKNETELKFDISWFSKSNYSRKYMLNIFNIEEKFANNREINRLKYKIKLPFVNNLLKKITKDNILFKKCYFNEKKFNFNANLSIIKLNNAYFEGYWQSEKYFIDIKDIIKKDFIIKIKPDKKIVKFLNKIKNEDSVSIHVRRGDYITNPKTNKYHGVCPLEYYQKAVHIIGDKIKNPVYYIFSDDFESVKKEMKLDIKYKIFEGNNDYDDFRLMQNCRHHITANSSFSWWSAWLSEYNNKIVICPSKWFNETIDTGDLIPQDWIQI